MLRTAIARLASSVSGVSRNHKTRQLEALVPSGSSVLAVGLSDPGYSKTHNQVELALAQRASVTGVYYPAIPGMREKVPFTLVRGDGCALPFADDSFDYVMSNAVVEHVGDAGRQRLFLAEAERVARHAVFHTTPNRWHPVETHTKTLLMHWLPRSLHPRLFSKPGRYRWHESDRLIGRREFRVLAGGDARVSGWPALWPLTLTVVKRVGR